MNGKIAKLSLAALLVLLPIVVSAEDRGFSDVDKSEPVQQAESVQQEATAGVNRALLIGNNEYESDHWPSLKTAVKDVEEIGNVLIARYSFKPEHVRIIKNGTRREMLRGFIDLAADAGPNDSVLIYYAGHGEFDKNERGWWVPVDGMDSTDYISNEDVLARLRTIKAKHKLLISDSCFSGNLLTRGAKAEFDLNAPVSGYYREKNRLISAQGLSSGGNEPVSDGGPEWGGNSIFAYHLIGVLKANQKRYLSASLLGYQLAEVVANDTATAIGVGQTPVFSSIKNQGDQGGEFFFIPVDIGPVQNVRVAVFHVQEEAQGSNEALRGARQIFGSSLIKQMENQHMTTVGEMQNISANGLERNITVYLQEAEVDAALVIYMTGELNKQDTLLWKGVTKLEANIVSYRLRDNKLRRVATHALKPQALPMRKWTEDPQKIQGQFQKTAAKMVRKWSKTKLRRFFVQYETE